MADPVQVKFSRQQIQFLEELYPEQNGPHMTPDQRLWNAAQRNLIAALKSHTAIPGEPY